MKYIGYIILSALLFNACLEIPNSFEKLPPGEWRAILKLSDQPILVGESGIVEADQKLDNYFELPFNFEITYDQSGEMSMVIKNADERITLVDLRYGRDISTTKDTVEFHFNDFDTYVDAFYEENFIEGYWKVPYRGNNYQIPFLAKYGDTHRFGIDSMDTNYNFNGKWKVEFDFTSENSWPAIAEFQQDGQNINGTFVTETGDYRYLQGNVEGEKMKLSVFDGSHAFLFSGKVSNDTILGEFRSGSHYKTTWKAYRDDAFELKDPFEMTTLTSEGAVDLKFKALNGQMVSLSDKEFDGKIKLVNIMGSWCPNCKDEILFLKEFQKEHPDIAIISIAFEKYRDEEKALEVLRRYRKTLDFNWPLLLGGYANKRETTELLGFVDKIYAYPTLLIVDANNEVVDIQTGFYGPATSQYKGFKESFYNVIENLNK